MHEKNNEIDHSSLGVHVRGAWGAVDPVKNSNASDFGEIWTKYLNFSKIINGSNQSNVVRHVRELWGVTAPKPPTPKIKNISDFGEIWTIYVNLH